MEKEEIDLYRLTEYKDYINLPYVKKADVYDEFLESMYLYKEKNQLHNKEEFFEVKFREFIDYNKKYDHYLFDLYNDFEIEKIRNIAVAWCNKNKIQYFDDMPKH